MASSAKRAGATPVRIGGFDDHVHLLLMTRPAIVQPKLVQQIKGESSRWISERFANLKTFRWQDGYSVFTVSKSAVSRVDRYIRDQRKHHSKMGFEDEYRKLLDLHEVDIVDERYLFG